MIPIQIDNNTYKSISAAWRAESPAGLKEITVRLRLRNGWPVKVAFKTPMIPAEERASTKDFIKRHGFQPRLKENS